MMGCTVIKENQKRSHSEQHFGNRRESVADPDSECAAFCCSEKVKWGRAEGREKR